MEDPEHVEDPEPTDGSEQMEHPAQSEDAGRGSWRRPSHWPIGTLLAMVTIAALFAALVLPNLLHNVQRSKQKRTMSDMRSLGTALGSYQVDYNGYPTDEAGLDKVLRLLESNYMVAPPSLDGWKMPYSYVTHQESGALFATSYTLTSYGSNRRADGFAHEVTPYFDCDLIYNDGQFVQAPEGICKG